ncbi:MAG: hypothetical protein M1358_13605 [Chloroflexi bacterium]|nr:hypothetical protein [Chloroflexota bacterium]
MKWRRRAFYFVVALVLATSLAPQKSAVSETFSPSGSAAGSFVPSADAERFGIDFISSIDVFKSNQGSPANRYYWASQAGANWNRWPFYWPEIEGQDGSFNYGYHDALVDSDLAQGMRINAVLMNTPGWATTSTQAPYGVQGEPAPEPQLGQKPPPPGFQPLESVQPADASPATYPPRNLYLPIFSDGTDTPGLGKSINQANYWARFVYYTVSRYKGKVSTWEMWNEPDFKPTSANGWFGFWSGSVADYARLLKVGYLAAKQADSSATVLMGGMAYWANQSFFGQLLDQIKSDSTAPSNNYFFDVTAWHWYSRASQMFDQVVATRNTLSSKGIAGKRIWVNESGVPAWDDPLNPPFDWTTNRWYAGSCTQAEQASYVIQALAYGLAANVERSFVFQELDDGNYEAFGLIRNNYTARPAYAAMQVAAQYFESYSSVAKATDGNVEKIVFWGTPKGKVTALWNRSGSDLTYQVASARAGKAYLVDRAGTITNLNAADPSFSIPLSRATCNYAASGTPDYIVGGSPYLLVEEVGVDNSNLRGYIRDNRGNAVIGAVAASGAAVSTVDGDGVYRLTVPAGSASVQASKSGFGTLPPAHLSMPSSGVTYFNFSLPPNPNAVTNGDFELGLNSWNTGGGVAPQISSMAHTGSGALVLGLGASGTGNSTLEQQISVPSGQPILSMTYWLQTADGPSNDLFQVSVVRGDGSSSPLLQDLTATVGYVHRWFDLSPWAGSTVRLRFNVWQSSADNPTNVYLDEVSVGPASPPPVKQYFPLVYRDSG